MMTSSLCTLGRRPAQFAAARFHTHFVRHCSASSGEGDPKVRLRTLRRSLAEFKALSSSDPRRQELQRRLPDEFKRAMPDLLKRGDLAATALRLPLGDPCVEDALKALMLLLSRRLRAQNNVLPAAELPSIPALLQRVGYSDNDFFDDFCNECGTSWAKLAGDAGEHQDLSALFRGVEDFSLLHPTRGTALDRLTFAVEKEYHSAQPYTAAQLSALCSAIMMVRMRSVCSPLLTVLRNDVLARAGLCDKKTDAALLLVAAAQLHTGGTAAGGPFPVDKLESMLQQAGDSFQEQASAHPLLATRAGVAACVQSCSLLWWTVPTATVDFVSKWLDRLNEQRNTQTKMFELAMWQGSRLPPAMRQLLGERLELTSESCRHLDEKAIVARLSLIHDLALTASLRGDHAACLKFAVQNEALISLLQAIPSSLQPKTSASAFVAIENCAQALEHISSGTTVDVSSTLAALEQHAQRLLSDLAAGWKELSAKDVQMVFRTARHKSATNLVRQALHTFDTTCSLAGQIAILDASIGLLPPQDVAKVCASLSARILKTTDRRDLSIAEASLRRGHFSRGSLDSNVAEAWSKTMSDLQRQLWKATLSSRPAWCQTPARGFTKYLQRCSARGRKAWNARLSENVAQERESHRGVQGLTATEDDHDPIGEAALELARPSSDKPRSPVHGVEWHRGMGSWEVRIEKKGNRVLDGYFMPRDGSPEEIDLARLRAEARATALQSAP